ncbi:MAG: TetR family transcriptional regulator [Mycobacteriales bacterium]
MSGPDSPQRVGPSRRTGRRPGDGRSRELILRAGQASFAATGYAATTIRGVAAAAGVDPALVHYFFGTKDGLFAAVMELPLDPSQVAEDVIAGEVDGLGERLARRFLEVWDDPATGPRLVGLIRGATSHQPSADLLREFVGREILLRIAGSSGRPDAALRANLCAAELIGTAMLRYVLRVEPLASADPAALVRWLGPTLQRYLVSESPHEPERWRGRSSERPVG